MSRLLSLPGLLALLLAQTAHGQTASPSARSLQVAGGTAAILAAAVDASGPRAHKTDFRCIIDDDVRACQKATDSTFHVAAAHAICSESDVAVGQFSCELSFAEGAPRAKGKLGGHLAFELYAALVSAGLRTGGAAGHIEVEATNVDCTLDMTALREKAGGGATCTLTAP